MNGEVLVRRTIERYVRLTDAEWAQVAPTWKERSHAKGAFISEAGRIEEHFHIVLSGVHRLYFEHDGTERCLGFAYAGTWSGDPDSFFSQRPGRFQLQALTASTTLAIHRDDLLAHYERIRAMERFGRLILEELLVGRATREVEMLTLNAEERYRKLLQRSAHLLQLVPQKDLASYLGMTPETFSRLRAKVRS
ncbi:MAG TPA: Crp/Fnr family transcriptional regulator [Flavobacteriales bacterium]